jgi:hypothetical protein
MLYRPLESTGQRESRDFACEAKFLLGSAQAEQISDWARRYMSADPHAEGDHQDQYRVSSVYFDTHDMAVYRKQGSYGRSKYRIRRYNGADVAFLERKTKNNSQVSKRRTLIPVAELLRFVPGRTTDSRWLGDWFVRRLDLRGLRPVCQVSYMRTARMAMSENGPCRLTLDADVQAATCGSVAFHEHAEHALLLPQRFVLELKYRLAPPQLFRQLLTEFAPLPQRVSKYRLAVETLQLVTQPWPTSEAV